MFGAFCSPHDSLLGTFFLERYMVHDNDHEIANFIQQFLEFLFNIRCLLIKICSIILQCSKIGSKKNEPRILE